MTWTDDEVAILRCVARSHGMAWAIAFADLCFDQAELIGHLPPRRASLRPSQN
jgi:hypothetical protein